MKHYKKLDDYAMYLNYIANRLKESNSRIIPFRQPKGINISEVKELLERFELKLVDGLKGIKYFKLK